MTVSVSSSDDSLKAAAAAAAATESTFKHNDDSSAHPSHGNHGGHDGHAADDHHDDHGSGPVPFYRPPRQRQRWGDAQLRPHTEWGDIFFDLFYVAAAYKLGNLLREDPSSRGLLYLVGCFFPIMNIWVSKTFYSARFYVVDDIFHRFFEVATLVPLATGVLHIRTVPVMSDPEHHVDMFAFALSITIGLCLSMARALEVMVCQRYFHADGLFPEAYYATRRDVTWALPALSCALAATIYAGNKFYGYSSSSETTAGYESETTAGYDKHRLLAGEEKPGPEDDVAIWLTLASPLSFLCIMVFFVVVVFGKVKDLKTTTVPMNIDYSIHRWGEWVMLLLGESVLSLLIVDLSEGYDYYKTFFSSVVTVILLEYLHFRSQPHDPDRHALRRSRVAGIFFSISMWVYSASLIVLGTSFKMFLFEFVYSDESTGSHRRLFPLPTRFLAGETTALRYDTDDRRQRIAHFFSASMALVWFCLDVTIVAHNGFREIFRRASSRNKLSQFKGFVLVAARVALTVFIATVSQYATEPAKLAFVGMAGVFLQLLLRVLLSVVYPFDQDEQEVERMATHMNALHRTIG